MFNKSVTSTQILTMSIFHPNPSLVWPPMIMSMGMNTSVPVTGPFMNDADGKMHETHEMFFQNSPTKAKVGLI